MGRCIINTIKPSNLLPNNLLSGGGKLNSPSQNKNLGSQKVVVKVRSAFVADSGSIYNVLHQRTQDMDLFDFRYSLRVILPITLHNIDI